MAEDYQRSVGRGAPLGRGSLLEMMKKRNERPPDILSEAANLSQLPSGVTSSQNIGCGRASLLNFVQKSSEASFPNSPQSGQSRGRASLLNLMKNRSTPPGLLEGSVQSTPPIIGPSGDVSGGMSEMSNLKISEPVQHTEPISRQGESGDVVELCANYIRLKVKPGTGIFEYEVKYSPDLDSRPLRSKLLSQHSQALGDARVFDGATLSLPYALEQPRLALRSEHPMDGSTVNLTIIYKRQRKFGEVTTLYNNLFRRIMHALDLVQIGRQHFNSRAAHSVPQHRLELWPGYVTAIDEYEGGLQLCLESTHRVLRTETVRDVLNNVLQRQGVGNSRDAVMRELMGKSVLTRYNNRVYRIEDIDWNATPLDTFNLIKEPGTQITFVDYYRSHWSIEIRDKKQPLLVYRSKKRLPTGEQIEEIGKLIPELCYLSGLTEPMKQDFKLMRDVADVTRTSPEHRVNVAHRFVEEVKKNALAVQLLANWGLSLDDSVVGLQGRTLRPENILFGKDQCHTGQMNADWNSAVCRMPMLSTPGLSNWCLLFCQKDRTVATDFHKMLSTVGGPMGMSICPGQLVELRNDYTETFLNELRKNISPQMEIMVIIFPTNRNDRYAAVKKFCCVQMPIASQVIISRTISRPDKLKSVTQKIALQINCKLGGTLWALKIRLQNCMVCGVDTHHAGAQLTKHGSVAGFVASLDNLFTRWFSKVCLQRPGQELVDSLKVCLVSALKAYHQVNKRFPDRIIMYRDGVGDGQLETVRKFEVKQLEESFSLIAPDYKPKLTVVIVQKRINTRIFLKKGKRIENPTPGTIVDSMITRRDYYDFFLVSQNVRQGSVSPTHYLVIHDGTAMKTDYLQHLTYKLCHMYYNWPGTVRVPAPCQYAHKLAFLVGQSIQMEPHQSLCNKLYYL